MATFSEAAEWMEQGHKAEFHGTLGVEIWEIINGQFLRAEQDILEYKSKIGVEHLRDQWKLVQWDLSDSQRRAIELFIVEIVSILGVSAQDQELINDRLVTFHIPIEEADKNE